MTKARLQELKQESFDKVWEHAVINNGAPSYVVGSKGLSRTDFVCKYRDGKDNRCFAGVLITDDEYAESGFLIEGTNASRALEMVWDEHDDRRDYAHTSFIGSLQRVHDFACSNIHRGHIPKPEKWGDMWKPLLITFAKNHNLNYPHQ